MLAFLVQGILAAPATPIPTADNRTLLYGGAAAGGLLLMFILVILSRGRKKVVDPEAGLGEDLAAIPTLGKGPPHYQLMVMNQPVRLRLVVVAPVGKRPVGKVDSALEQVYRHLGEVTLDDKPRVRIWPPQLSSQAFAPTFFRLTKRPEPDGKPSRWILLAGPARAGSTPILLGLAVQAESAVNMGLLTMTERQWGEVLRVENA